MASSSGLGRAFTRYDNSGFFQGAKDKEFDVNLLCDILMKIAQRIEITHTKQVELIH